MHGNHKYPNSRRMTSRPYYGFLHTHKERQPLTLHIFKNALLDIGQSMVGHPFYYCCDVDRFPTPCFSPSFFSITPIVKYTETGDFQQYRTCLPESVRQALDNITKVLVDTEEIDRKRAEGKKIEPFAYDLSDLTASFKVYWDHDTMMDARIIHAEELFFRGNEQKTLHGEEGKERYIASLEWMAHPENASRVALMFLYSRLAQHFGETNDDSWPIAQAFAERLDQGGNDKDVIESAPQMLEDYLSLRQHGGDGRENLKLRDDNKNPNINVAALKQSMPQMVEDYHDLRTGRWAKEQIIALTQPAVTQHPAPPIP